ncbi:cobalt ABC transporter ATP-binding protein, partial [Mycobacterium tuberculosis]|uniref:hypothetical protein n=1 Tax=Mycobacterium tuberculosis TaxID=1773 RepID=UPI000E37ADB9
PPAAVGRLLRAVGLAALAARAPGRLSGGALPRLALAAALARAPALLLAAAVPPLVAPPGRDALLAVLSGLPPRPRPALVPLPP